MIQAKTVTVKEKRRCHLCKVLCLPKNGDWFVPNALENQQNFLCKGCESVSRKTHSRVIPIK